MKLRPALPWLVCCLATAHAARVEPGLPVWDENERARMQSEGWVAGGILLTDDPIPAEPEKTEQPALDVAQPTAEEIAEAQVPPDEIPEQYWPAYFDERPKSFLIDPQGLLGSVDSKNRLGFLNYHAGDSSIDLFVYVFKGDQEIPGAVREEELVERFYAEGRPAVVVFYFMGAPQRSMIYLSPSLTDAVSAPEQRRALESSVMQAFKDVDPAGQIEAFLVQMSIRIYWMERMLGGGAAPDEEALVVVKPRRSPVEKKDGLKEKLQPFADKAKGLAAPAAFCGGVFFCALGFGSWMKRRARYRFPEFDVEPRLGGAHAAGVGAVISFASASVPPASQRDQVPDYLRRM